VRDCLPDEGIGLRHTGAILGCTPGQVNESAGMRICRKKGTTPGVCERPLARRSVARSRSPGKQNSEDIVLTRTGFLLIVSAFSRLLLT